MTSSQRGTEGSKRWNQSTRMRRVMYLTIAAVAMLCGPGFAQEKKSNAAMEATLAQRPAVAGDLPLSFSSTRS
jgi:hypothetical protein